ncbi:MAG: MFS transporter [Gemmatales bacterium]|nr:MFS transporter [Gemmatales bacterium]MDW8386760.1 MFS transporter [Gemmatales bacterium]
MSERWYQNATRGQWMALAAALLGWMFDGFEMGIFPPLSRTALVALLAPTSTSPPAQSLSEGESRSAKQELERLVGEWNGYIYAAFLVGAACGGWLFGWLGDRIGRVRAMIGSVLTYAIFTGLCGLAMSAWHLAALRFIAALGMGGEWALGVALVMESWPARSRVVLAGLIGAAANVGFMLAALLVLATSALGLKAEDGGWRWLLGFCAFPALLTFFIRMFVPESEKWQEAVQTGPRPSLVEIFTPEVRFRTLLGATLAGIALLGTWGSVQWVPPWVSKMAGPQMASLAQICSGLGAVFGSFCGAVIGDKLTRRYAYFCLCLGSLGICALLFRYPADFGDYPIQGAGSLMEWLGYVDWRFMGIIFMTGFLTASFYGWLPLYLPELFPTRIRATGQGFGFNAGRIVAAVGALSMGYLMKYAFHGDYGQAGATISLVYAVGLLVIWLAPETKGKPLPE